MLSRVARVALGTNVISCSGCYSFSSIRAKPLRFEWDKVSVLGNSAVRQFHDNANINGQISKSAKNTAFTLNGKNGDGGVDKSEDEVVTKDLKKAPIVPEDRLDTLTLPGFSLDSSDDSAEAQIRPPKLYAAYKPPASYYTEAKPLKTSPPPPSRPPKPTKPSWFRALARSNDSNHKGIAAGDKPLSSSNTSMGDKSTSELVTDGVSSTSPGSSTATEPLSLGGSTHRSSKPDKFVFLPGGKASVPVPSSDTALSGSSTSQTVLENVEDGVLTLALNRPESSNRLTWPMYSLLSDRLTRVNLDDTVCVIVLTGAGDAFSAGDEPSVEEFPEKLPISKESLIDDSCSRIKELVDAVICVDKPIIAAVDGPCYGLPFFLLPLMDLVLCSSRAKFGAAVVELCQTPYGCASSTFPQLMGNSSANEVFLQSKELTADDALRLNFASCVYSDGSTLSRATREHAVKLAGFPDSTRELFKQHRVQNRHNLLKINEEEIEQLRMFWCSEEFRSVAMNISQA